MSNEYFQVMNSFASSDEYWKRHAHLKTTTQRHTHIYLISSRSTLLPFIIPFANVDPTSHLWCYLTIQWFYIKFSFPACVNRASCTSWLVRRCWNSIEALFFCPSVRPVLWFSRVSTCKGSAGTFCVIDRFHAELPGFAKAVSVFYGDVTQSGGFHQT